ncbi:MAG: bifunctional isocitrate dehydrogenase kinase/phosphatase [Burkholderiaceae bacterium]|jgi:isocitrate dehydrogenase kinase/phosphatase
METRRNQSALALAIAQVVLWGFNKHYRLFRECTQAAKERFEQSQWQAVQSAQRERIQFYDQRVLETVERLETEFQTESLPEAVWQQVKYHYINLLIDHKQPECAETFFNSVCCKILHRDYFRNEYIFVRPTISTEHLDSDPPAYRSYYPNDEGLLPTLGRVFEDFALNCPYQDLERDLRLVVDAAKARFPKPFKPEPNHQLQVLSSLFFRNKGAYVIGKVINGHTEWPFAIPLIHAADGRLAIDTILFDPIDLLALFSFSRAYFMVDTEVPAAYVQFLRSMLPTRPKFELYNMLGLQKHGKALFYRDFLHHLNHSSDLFTIAPGIKGLVMIVFTLPSFPYVFKIIKDNIPHPKEVDREGVKAKYWLVKLHDRVGRMADTLEYSDVAFPTARFSAELLEEIRSQVPSLLLEQGDTLVIRHLYIERRMTPLNLFLQSASREDVKRTLDEYGRAIKQLAAANIFPGDMLYKNFGVTRQKRVVFYDYDEIEYMTACNFRVVPLAQTPEQEMASEPWYSVQKNDVFPEEWKTFLLGDPVIREVLMELHPDLFEASFWQALKKRIEGGHIEDVYPYSDAVRFDPARLSA